MLPSSPPQTPFAYVPRWDRLLQEGGWWHSFELPDGQEIRGVCPLDSLQARIAQFPIPADLRGQRVLDIGAWDGWFSFEMERRGAEVLAIDTWDNPRFREIHAVYRSRVDYRQMDVYELTPDRVGRFNIVLFMGVLYHLKHPLLALERVCALTENLAAIDSFVLREKHLPGATVEARPVMEFYETDEFGGQVDNWCGPSLPALLALCRTAGFARVELRQELEYSACVACYRRWEEPDEERAAPELRAVFHHTNAGINFETRYDEYVNAWFASPEEGLTRFDVQPEVGGYGAIPISLHQREGGLWEASFKLPALPGPGWYEVTLRVWNGQRSTARRIAVDLPVAGFPFRLRSVCDGKTWREGELDWRLSDTLSLFTEGLPEQADRHNLRVEVNGRRLPVEYLNEFAPGAERQMNVRVPAPPPEEMAVSIRFGDQQSGPLPVRVVNER